MRSQGKNPSLRQTWRRWSPLRRFFALSYGLLFICAVTGIGFFVFGGVDYPLKRSENIQGASALIAPFASVILKEKEISPAELPGNPKRGPVFEAGRHTSDMRIVIVIDDMGPDNGEAKRAIALDPNVTLSFLPYAKNVRALAAEAQTAGHELLLHLPMEPTNHHLNPGPHALLAALSSPEIIERLDWNLSQFDGYVGINNHMGSVFTANAVDMTQVMEVLKGRGLMFLDSRTTDATVGRRVATQVGIPFAERDVFLDNEVDFSAVETQLEKLVSIARKHGLAIAIGHPHKVTIEKLESWIPTLKKQGITLVPLSRAVVRPVTIVKAESNTL